MFDHSHLTSEDIDEMLWLAVKAGLGALAVVSVIAGVLG